MFKSLEESLDQNKLDIEREQNLLNSLLKANWNFPIGPEHVIKHGALIVNASRIYESLCKIRANLLIHSTKDISWRHVLDFKRHVGMFDDGLQEARNLNYPYFLWNGKIYASDMEDMIPLGLVDDLG